MYMYFYVFTANLDMCDYLEFQCSLCARVNRISTAHRNSPSYVLRYFVTSCCGILVCNVCVQSNIARPDTFKCMLCSTDAWIVERRKDGENADRWNRDNCALSTFHSSLLYQGLILLIPFTAKKQFGTWREVAKIVFRSRSRFVHPDYKKCIEKYNDFVNNFYAKQQLFYLFHSSYLRKMQHSAFIRKFVPSSMPEFFDTQKCYLRLVSRKLFLKQNPFGFVILVIKRLSLRNLFSFNLILHAFLSNKR